MEKAAKGKGNKLPRQIRSKHGTVWSVTRTMQIANLGRNGSEVLIALSGPTRLVLKAMTFITAITAVSCQINMARQSKGQEFPLIEHVHIVY